MFAINSKPIPKLTLIEQNRFWLNVDRSRGRNSCWSWKGFVRSTGYGICCFRSVEFKAHRVAYLLANGRIRSDLLVMHSCDNRRCRNPRHLRQGTPKQNSQDSVRKGRNTRLRGEHNGKAKLTRRQVREIRQTLRDAASGKIKIYQYQIARYYGISEATVSYLKNGGRWDDVPRR